MDFRLGRDPESPVSSGTAGLGRRKATCSLALLLASVRPLRREEGPSLVAVCQRMATCDSREKLQTAPPHDVARDGGRSGFPASVIYIMISVVGYLRPSKVLRPHANHMLPPSAGVRLFWSLLLHPEEGLQRSKKDLTTNRSCWTSPYVVSWKGPVLKALAEGHPDGHLFEINDTDFL